MATPLGRVRGLGSAKSGTTEFLKERLTGVGLLVLLPYLALFLIPVMGRPREELVAVVGSLWVAPALIATILINASHMSSGMRVIIEDYAHAEWTKFPLLLINWTFSWGCGLVASIAVVRMMFLAATS
jgi:succinate dehydrogenase / fumarate reductase membrane anchor subunit